MILQLAPPIPVDTPKGKGHAAFLIDYGPDLDLYWVIFLESSREFWTYKSREIQAQLNFTLGPSARDHGKNAA